MQHRFISIATLILSLGLIAGCEQREPKVGRTPIAMEKAPANLLAVAKQHLPKVDFQEVWENHVEGNKNVHSYEFRGRTSDGTNREIRIGLDGKIHEED